MKKVTSQIGKRVLSVDPQAVAMIEQYDWPGNVRELENVINASVHLTDDEVIGIEDLPDYLIKQSQSQVPEKSLKEIVEKTEKKAIEKTLIKYRFDKNRTAKALGIGNSTLYEKIKKYKLGDHSNVNPDFQNTF